MRILQLISSEGFYGAESMMIGLCDELTRLGCEVALGVFQDGRRAHTEVAAVAKARGLNVCFLPCRTRWDWNTVRLIRREIDGYGVDVVHAHGYKADVYSYLASRRQPPVLVSTCHSWPQGARILRLYAVIDRLALRAFDEVATMSPDVVAILTRSGVARSKIHCIWNGVDSGRFEHNEATLRSEIPGIGRSVVGLVARMVPYKGAPTLLQAARQVLKVDADVTFVLVGEGPARKDFERTAAELGVAQNVVFTGVRKDMPGVYASLDVLVLPSAEEAMPMALLEGMSAGKPVIATAVGAVPELVIHEKTGYLVPVGASDALASCILRLLRNRKLAAAVGKAAREHIVANFSLAATARKYLSLYEKALERRTARTMAPGTIHHL